MSDPKLLETSQPLNSHNLVDNKIFASAVVDTDFEVRKMMVVNLLHLGLLCSLPNPKAQPAMGQVNRILQQIRDMESTTPLITRMSMPPLPATKPLGLYRSLESSQTASSFSDGPSPAFDGPSPSSKHLHPHTLSLHSMASGMAWAPHPYPGR